MATVQQAAGAHEGQFFVGREREVAEFRAWLSGEAPAILSVSGPGGIGKTALIGAFEREARAIGRPVVKVDGRDILPTPDDLLAALGHRTLDRALAELGAARPLLLIDAFESLGGLTRFLRESLVPGLDPSVRLVLAGRYPLGAWRTGERWPVPIRSLPIERLDRDQSRTYLERRGVTAGELRDQILASCGGWPLALSLAADLVDQFGIRRLPSAPEWRLAVRGLVEQLLDEAADPALRTLLEAGAVVRQFDEDTLAAVAGQPAGTAFAALCRMSTVRPTARGLALHDDIRRLVVDDLRWRRPERHADLRLRALAHFRERASQAAPEERERLLEERLFLWGHEVVQSLLYVGDEPGEVWVEAARPGDRDELMALHKRWQLEVRPALGLAPADAPWDPEPHFAWFERLVSEPGVRVRIARDRTGEALGYDALMPVCEATLPLAREHEVIGTAVAAYLELPGAGPLRARPDETDLVFLAHLGLGGRLPEPTRAALIRDLLSVLARGGACLCSLDMEDYRRLAEALGFRPIPGSEARFRGDEYLGYALDLRRVGAEPWLQALLANGPLPPVGPGALEQELREVLAAWHDDRRVGTSSLRALAGSGSGPEEIRALVRSALGRARATCAPDQEAALRAVELAYLERATSHERAAGELHVSRSTFYRLLHRGVELTAAALPAVATG
jgi:hypothetical protein